ncbi:hypothetical protein [Mucilaginibacter frigoritolerans]|uniref:hypothetical protein n=1 Tax=Mucilaginibacter frigoritolerans TaxID=652788 RepID=UPI0011A18118|nr:hypothetical protein [Mucilaginibacter frigoritolerans]
MDQYNNSQNEFLWTLLADPAGDVKAHVYDLQRLVNDFPQSGILQALLAHASDEKNLKQASVYFNPKALYKLINTPGAFIGVPNEKINIQKSLSSNRYYEDEDSAAVEHTFSYPTTDSNTEQISGENYFNEQPAAEVEDLLHESIDENISHTDTANEPVLHDQITEQHLNNVVHEIENIKPLEEPVGLIDEVPVSAIPETSADIVNNVEDHHLNNHIVETAESYEEQEAVALNSVEEETFDEITGIEEVSITEPLKTEETAENKEEEHKEPEHKEEMYRPSFHPNWRDSPGEELEIDDDELAYDEAEKLITDSIASTDYFMFDNTLVEPKATEPEETGLQAPAVSAITEPEVSTLPNDAEQHDVSRYDDDKMPYTFMWWLDKTRKEHASIYQPYVKAREVAKPESNVKKQADELQHQYYENIFHITSVDELDKGTPLNENAPIPDAKRKEQLIIERFIQEEPQIRPQSSDKLDNENKAKKSSEDRDELVTETLASIYTEQMLYHKAIASYKKLMLKFPEKSRYFAAKIEQLEKKTN